MPSQPARVRSAAYSFLRASPRAQRPHRSHGHTHTHYRTGSRCSFSTSSRLLHAASREPSLYEILDVPVTASISEIKKYVERPPSFHTQPGQYKNERDTERQIAQSTNKPRKNRQFYSLSLRHHPDRNRSDPTASSRFTRISNAYQVLGDAAKRASYDREHGIHAHLASTHSTANPGQHPMGSYSSHNANVHSKGASYAGSRPASGLSKRRGVFKGPPPSFYAHGGYGAFWRRGETPGGTGGGGGGGSGAAFAGKMDDDPTAFVDRNTLHHFNARGHYRTQTAEDMRRQKRRSKEMSAALNEQYIGGPGDFFMRFTIVCCILMGAGALTGFLWPREKSRKNGSGRWRDN